MFLLNLGIVHGAFVLAPVSKRNISPQHSAKVRKMGDALVSSEHAAEQFEQTVENHEIGGNSKTIVRRGKSIPNASKIPKIAPDAPTVG